MGSICFVLIREVIFTTLIANKTVKIPNRELSDEDIEIHLLLTDRDLNHKPQKEGK